MIAEVAEVVEDTGVVAVVGIVVAFCFVISVSVVVAFGFVVVLMEVLVGVIGIDAVVMAAVALLVPFTKAVGGVVIVAVRVIADDVLVLGLVAVVIDTVVVFSTRTLVLVSSAAAVVDSVCTAAVVVAVMVVSFVVVFADVIGVNFAEVADAVIPVTSAEVVLLSAKYNDTRNMFSGTWYFSYSRHIGILLPISVFTL